MGTLYHVDCLYVEEEELSGKLGMELFVHMDEFRQLNVGYAFDEGLANPTDAFSVYYGERITRREFIAIYSVYRELYPF